LVNDTKVTQQIRVSVCRTSTLYFWYNNKCQAAEYPCGDTDIWFGKRLIYAGYSSGRDDQVVSLKAGQSLALKKYRSPGVSSHGLVSGGSWEEVK